MGSRSGQSLPVQPGLSRAMPRTAAAESAGNRGPERDGSGGEKGAGGRMILRAHAGVEGEASVPGQEPHGPPEIGAGAEAPAGENVRGHGAEVGGGMGAEGRAQGRRGNVAAAGRPAAKALDQALQVFEAA